MSFAGTEQLPALPAPSGQDPGLCPQCSVPEVGSQRIPPPSTLPMAPSDPHGYLMAIQQWHHPPPSSLPEVIPPVARCPPLCLDFPTLLLSPCPAWRDGAKRCSCSVGSRDRGRTPCPRRSVRCWTRSAALPVENRVVGAAPAPGPRHHHTGRPPPGQGRATTASLWPSPVPCSSRTSR